MGNWLEPFTISIAPKVEKLGAENLTEEEKACLLANLNYNPSIHCIYKVLVGPSFNKKVASKRDFKRFNFSKVNKFCIHIKLLDSKAVLLRIFPNTQVICHKTANELEGKVSLDVGIQKDTKISLNGRWKHVGQNSRFSIIAQRIPPNAHWIFMPPKIQPNFLHVLLLFELPENEEDKQVLFCKASAKQNNRIIAQKSKRIIF